MNTKNALYGALCGALVFSVLAHKKAVSAAVLATPSAGSFEIAQMQGNSGDTQGVFLLDTETLLFGLSAFPQQSSAIPEVKTEIPVNL